MKHTVEPISENRCLVYDSQGQVSIVADKDLPQWLRDFEAAQDRSTAVEAKPKRTRRTKAEIEAAKAQEAQG